MVKSMKAKSLMDLVKLSLDIPMLLEVRALFYHNIIILLLKDHSLFQCPMRQLCKKRLGHYRCSRIFAYAISCMKEIYSIKQCETEPMQQGY